MTKIQTISKTEIEKIGDVAKLAELNGVAKAAMQFYKAKDDHIMSQRAKEMYFRSARQAGFLLLPENTPRETKNRYSSSFHVERATQYQEALKGAGITPKIANTWQKLAQVGEKLFEEYLAAAIYEWGEYTIHGLLKYAQMPHVGFNSGENEWYTPPEYIKAARAVMGSIDVDPASSDKANEIVKAKVYYTREDDGLTKDWAGKVWLNPPYSLELLRLFVKKYTASILDGSVKEGIVLVNNATETNWFMQLVNVSSAIVFVKGRVRFLDIDGNPGAPLQGQALIYSGDAPDKFLSEFLHFGWGARL